MIMRGRQCWLAALAVLLAPAGPALGAVYTAGHADIGVGYEEEELHLHFHAHTGATVDGVKLPDDAEYELGAVTIVVPLHEKVYVTKFGDSDDLDVPESLKLNQGDFFWNLPDRGYAGVPFLGLSTEHLDFDLFSSVRLTLLDMTAPENGHFTLWRGGEDGSLLMQTGDGISESADYVDMSVPEHGHTNYAFSQAGDYFVQFKAYGYLFDGGVLTDEGTIHFQVVPEPSSLALAGLGMGSVLSLYLVRRRRARNASGQKV